MGYDGRGTLFPLTIARGADMAFQLTVTDADDVAVDVSTATIAGNIYTTAGVLVDSMTATVSGDDDNVITLSFTSAETALLTSTQYQWSLLVTRGGAVRPWLAGPVVVLDSTSGGRSTSGNTTLTVDSDLTVAVTVAAVGGSGGGAVDSVNGETGTVVIDAADIDIADVAGYYTAGDVEGALAELPDLFATAAQGGLADTALQPGDGLDALDSAADSKLAGIEAGADVTDTTNVTAAGALMDYEVDADIKTLSLPANTTISAFGATLVDDADASTARTTLGVVIGTNVQAFDADILKADTADTLTAGFDSSDYAAGTKSSGTYTPDPANGNFQVATNGGAHTLAPPATSCSIVIHYTNNGSAGAITTSGFTAVTGDAFTTTNGHEFMCVVTKINDVSVLNVTALQ